MHLVLCLNQTRTKCFVFFKITVVQSSNNSKIVALHGSFIEQRRNFSKSLGSSDLRIWFPMQRVMVLKKVFRYIIVFCCLPYD